MKYTIEGFNQEKLVSLGLDATDAIVLRWFVDFFGSGRMKRLIDQDKIYFLVMYKGILEDLPSLGITSTKAIGRKFDKYVQKGLLLKTIKRRGNGTILFFCPTPLLTDLQYSSIKGSPVSVEEDRSSKEAEYGQNILNFSDVQQGANTVDSERTFESLRKSTKGHPRAIGTEPTSERTRKSFREPVKGQRRAVRKDIPVPSERTSEGGHFKTDYSTKNSSTTATTDSLTNTLVTEKQGSPTEAAAVLKNEFAKKVNAAVFSPDFWLETAESLYSHGLEPNQFADYVEYVFDYARKNNPRNLNHYLYRTAGKDYVIAEFRNYLNQKKLEQKKEELSRNHCCPLCLTIFDTSKAACPACGLKIIDRYNEATRIEAKKVYTQRE